jgi:hypothetical protein
MKKDKLCNIEEAYGCVYTWVAAKKLRKKKRLVSVGVTLSKSMVELIPG